MDWRSIGRRCGWWSGARGVEGEDGRCRYRVRYFPRIWWTASILGWPRLADAGVVRLLRGILPETADDPERASSAGGAVRGRRAALQKNTASAGFMSCSITPIHDRKKGWSPVLADRGMFQIEVGGHRGEMACGIRVSQGWSFGYCQKRVRDHVCKLVNYGSPARVHVG